MEVFPSLQLGWLNGWIPVVLFFGIYLVVLKIFPGHTVERLYDDSGWTLEISRPARIGLPFALAAILLIIFTPLKFPRPVFWAGLILALIGELGFIYSLHSFNITPGDQPVTTGLYRFSRNPQWVAFAVVMLGFSLMVGSWTVLILLAVRVIMNHFRILGEERALENQYGEDYLKFKQSVPRYLLFF